MMRTQIQLPDALYRQAKEVAAAREISLAELVRCGLEYILRVSAPPRNEDALWTLPDPVDLGVSDPFDDPDWRFKLHARHVAETGPEYAAATKRRRKR